MSKSSLLFFAILCFNLVFSQEIKTDNSLTGIVSNSISSQLGLTYVGENSFIKNKWDITSVTNYALTFSPNISENELTQRLSYNLKLGNWSNFISYQFNYSYVRKIDSDNLFGIGTGIKKDYNWIKSSISYAILFQNTNYSLQTSEYLLRHSIRIKFIIEKDNFELISEYYYQPDILNFNNTIIYGTTKINFLPKNKINFTISDILNYRSQSNVKLIHNLTIGVGYKLQKKITR
jgi:hypothetical protein